MSVQAQAPTHTSLSEEQVRMYFNSTQNIITAAAIITIGIIAFIIGVVFPLSWLWIIGIIMAVAGGGYLYYVIQQTPSDQDFDNHMNTLSNDLYHAANTRLNLAHLDPLTIQSFVMPGMPLAETRGREDIMVKRCKDHLRSSLSKYTFIFVGANIFGIYEGYIDAFNGSIDEGNTRIQYRWSSILSIEAIHGTTDIEIELGDEPYHYRQEAMTLELTNGRCISITVFASPINHDLPTFFATSRANASYIYNTITYWWQQ